MTVSEKALKSSRARLGCLGEGDEPHFGREGSNLPAS